MGKYKEMGVVEIGENEIRQYTRSVASRKIRESTVREIISSLVGMPVPTINGVLTVRWDERIGKYIVLNGNHRYEAMVSFLNDYPTRKIKVFREVDDVDAIEGKRVIRELNSTIQHSKADYFVEQAFDSKIYKEFVLNKEQLPCEVEVYSAGRDAFSLVALVDAYMTRKNKTLCVMNKDEMLGAITKATPSDIVGMKHFLEDFVSIFGTPNREMYQLTQGFIRAMLKCWFQFYEIGMRKYFVDTFNNAKKSGEYDSKMIKILATYRRMNEGSRQTYRLILKIMNSGKIAKGDRVESLIPFEFGEKTI